MSKRRSDNPDYDRIRLAFANSVFFRELPAATLDCLAGAATLQYFREARLVHCAGVPATKLWLVVSGALRISLPAPGGTPVMLSVLGEGGFHGVASLVEGTISNTECHAECDTTVAVIETSVLRNIEAFDADLRQLIPKLLMGRIKILMSLLADAVAAPLQQRIARRLLTQALASGRGADESEIELHTSQSDLVAMLGASRSRVSAEVRNLKNAEVVRVGYRRLYIRDFERLQELAGPGVRPL